MTAASPQVIIREMLTPQHAIDDYLGDLARRNYAVRTLANYRRTLDLFCDTLPERIDVSEIGEPHVRRFLDRRPKRVERYSAGTRAQDHAALGGWFLWLWHGGKIERSPMEHIAPPVRPDPDDVDVVTVSSRDAARLLQEARAGSWSERLAVECALYLGPRRRALARLTLADYNRERGELRFREKGGKTVWKPIPNALRQTLETAIAAGVYGEDRGVVGGGGRKRVVLRCTRSADVTSAGDSAGQPASTSPPAENAYLIPPQGSLRREGERDDRVIWRLVKEVAARCGIEAHVHALRAAFATYCAEQGMSREAVQHLLGHRNPSTTELYFRRLDRRRIMEPVRELQWRIGDSLADPLESTAGVGAGGFEPPFPANPPAEEEDLLRRPHEGPLQ